LTGEELVASWILASPPKPFSSAIILNQILNRTPLCSQNYSIYVVACKTHVLPNINQTCQPSGKIVVAFKVFRKI
jgi:hypothetical protein